MVRPTWVHFGSTSFKLEMKCGSQNTLQDRRIEKRLDMGIRFGPFLFWVKSPLDGPEFPSHLHRLYLHLSTWASSYQKKKKKTTFFASMLLSVIISHVKNVGKQRKNLSRRTGKTVTIWKPPKRGINIWKPPKLSCIFFFLFYFFGKSQRDWIIEHRSD